MLSETICTLRRKNGLSQEQLAEKLGVSRQTVSKWETGASTPELDKLRALSEFFRVSMDELTGSPPPEGKPAPAGPGGRAESRLGVGLCLLGALGLLLFGVLTMVLPSAAGKLDASSAVTLHGTGLLMALFVLLLLAGIVLILRKK